MTFASHPYIPVSIIVPSVATTDEIYPYLHPFRSSVWARQVIIIDVSTKKLDLSYFSTLFPPNFLVRCRLFNQITFFIQVRPETKAFIRPI